ncbi:hypothetical protein ACIA5D_43925 [Actinoplanes sp. NPDC051513]|uniref:hypothetical protein n=1 Tax=Actinoplanes sp. NPDC051513 TaxID=3363908 RepID=UPI00378A365B
MRTSPRCPYQISVSGYPLAALAPPEWRDLDRHLRIRRACQSEVVEVAAVLALLSRMRFDDRRVLESAITRQADVRPPGRGLSMGAQQDWSA